jgi:dUTP pyrophosphatase
MKVKFKKLREDATIPTRATDGSAGFDLTAVEDLTPCSKYGTYSYKTGIAVEIPEGYVGLLVPRSSIFKVGLSLCNSCGIIDWDFRGGIELKFYNVAVGDEDNLPKKGDRIGQLVVVPCLTEAEEVTELSETVRGSGGWGHSGK